MINNRLLSGCGCKSTAGREVLEGAADGYMMGAITGFITGGMTSKQCFVAGTSILTSAGLVAIENIRAGDMVWASDLTKSLFHMNIQFSKATNFHIPIGILGSGLWGGMNRD